MDSRNYGLRKTLLIKSLKSPLFIGRLDKQATSKNDQTLFKSKPHHLYHFY